MAGIHNILAGSGGGAFVFNDTVSANVTTGYDLRARAITAGWDGLKALQAQVTINSGVTVSSNSTSTVAFDTGTTSYPAGSSLVLTNAGSIIGMGGAGGRGGGSTSSYGYVTGGPGLAGGTALRVNLLATIDNTGTIAGGGGGGGGGFGTYVSQGTGKDQTYNIFNGGGGGGGRSGATNAAGGAAGAGSASPLTATYAGAAGGSGTSASAGSGGAGGSGLGVSVGTGGTGGGYGAAGSTGGTYGGLSPGYPGIGPYSGGAGGAAVSGDSNITWTNTGTRLGAIS